MSQDLKDFISKNKKIFDGQVTEVNLKGQYKVYSSSLGRSVSARGGYEFGVGDSVLLGKQGESFFILNNKQNSVVSSISSSSQLTHVSEFRPEVYTYDTEQTGFLTPVIFKGAHIAWPIRYSYFEGSTSQVPQVNQIGAFSFITGIGGTTNTSLVNPTQGITYNCWLEAFLDVKTNMSFPEKWSRSDSWPRGQEPKSRELKKKYETVSATSSQGAFGSASSIAPASRGFEIIDLTIKRQGIAPLGEQIIKSLASNVFDFMSTSNLVDTMVQLEPFILPTFDKTEYGLATPRSSEDLFRNNMLDTRDAQNPIDYSDPPDSDPFNSSVSLNRSGDETDFIRFIRINSAQLENSRITNSFNGTYPIHFGYIFPLWNTRLDSVGPSARFQVGSEESGGITFAIGGSAWEFIAFVRDFSLPPPAPPPDDGIERPDRPVTPDDFIRPTIKNYVIRSNPFYPIYKESVASYLNSDRTSPSGLSFFRELLPDYEVELRNTYSGSRILGEFFRNLQLRIGTTPITVNGYGVRQSEIFPFLVFNNNGLVGTDFMGTTELDYEGVSFTSPRLETTINIEAVSSSTPWIKKATIEVLVQDNVNNPQYSGITTDIIYDEGVLVRGEYEKKSVSFGDLSTTRWEEVRVIDEINLREEDINGIPALEDEGEVRCRFKTTEQSLPPGQKWVKYCTIYRADVNGAFTSGESIARLINNPSYIGIGNPNNSPYVYLYEHEGIEGVLQVRFTIDQVFRSINCIESFNGVICRISDIKSYTTAVMFPSIRLLSFQRSTNLGSFYKSLGFEFDVATDLSLLPDNAQPDPNESSTGFINGTASLVKILPNYGNRKQIRLPDPESDDPILQLSPITEAIYLAASLSSNPFRYPPLLEGIGGTGNITSSPFPPSIDSNEDAIKDDTWEFYDRINYMLFAPFNFELYKLLQTDRNIFRNRRGFASKPNHLLQAYEWFNLLSPSGVFR